MAKMIKTLSYLGGLNNMHIRNVIPVSPEFSYTIKIRSMKRKCWPSKLLADLQLA